MSVTWAWRGVSSFSQNPMRNWVESRPIPALWVISSATVPGGASGPSGVVNGVSHLSAPPSTRDSTHNAVITLEFDARSTGRVALTAWVSVPSSSTEIAVSPAPPSRAQLSKTVTGSDAAAGAVVQRPNRRARKRRMRAGYQTAGCGGKTGSGVDRAINGGNPLNCLFGRQFLALACAAGGEFDHAVLEPAGADRDAPRQTDQVHRRELAARPFIAVVVKRVEAQRLEAVIERLTGCIGFGVSLLEVDDAGMERGHTFGPDDALVVVAGLDDRAQQTADADAVRPHVHRNAGAVGIGHCRAHRFGILGAEIEDLPHLDAAGGAPAVFGNLGELGRVMGFIGAGIAGGEFFQHGLAFFDAVIIDGAVTEFQVGDYRIIEHLGFARVRQHKEFMRVIAADGAGIGAHRDRLQPHAFVGAQVADEVAVIGVQRVFLGQVEGIAVLHQEFAAPHDAETGADLVAELPLDVIEGQRQVLVAAHMGAEDVGD